jgi:hypothetical protein
MKHASVYWAGCLLLLAAAETVAQGRNGGDVPERTMEALRAVIAEGIASKAPRIVIPPGIYRGGPAPRPDGKASPDRAGSNVHVLIENLSDTEIIAEGVTLLCTNLTRAIMFRNCKNVELRGLTVDYDPLPFTQGDIVEVNGPEGWLDVKIHAGYPVRAQGRIDIVDRQTRFRRENMPFMWGSRPELRSGGVVRIHNRSAAGFARAGDMASLSGNMHYALAHTIGIEACDGMVLREVCVYSSNCMGIIAGGGEGGHQFVACRVVPGPPPKGAVEPRLLSTNADAMLTKQMRKGVLTEGCEIRDAGDDSWSVTSDSFVILKKEGKTLYLTPWHTSAPLPGDHLCASLDTPSLAVKTVAAVPAKSVELSAAMRQQVTNAASELRFSLKAGFKNEGMLCKVEMETDVPWGEGASVYCPDRQGNGFIFRNNRVRSSGRILIKASGLVEGNTFERIKAIVVRPEVPRRAAAGIAEIVIRNNTIIDANMQTPYSGRAQAGAVCVAAEGEKGQPRPAGIFGRVVIEGNTIRGGNGAAVVVTSAKEVQIANNRLETPLHVEPNDNGSGYGVDNHALYWFATCGSVSLEKNTVVNPGPFLSTEVGRGPGVAQIREAPKQDQK